MGSGEGGVGGGCWGWVLWCVCVFGEEFERGRALRLTGMLWLLSMCKTPCLMASRVNDSCLGI